MKTTIFQGFFRFAVTLIVLAGCQEQTAQAPQAVTHQAAATSDTPRHENDFPTLARVEYVMQCMQEHGGQNYDNLYHCACAADTIASQLSYEDFGQALTFTYLFSMAGERGGEFRDPPQSERLRTRLKDAKALAHSTCFPKQLQGHEARPAAR
jgi:hypothetical protein